MQFCLIPDLLLMEELMKKYLMIILALVLVFAMVAGCAPKGGTDPTEPVKTEGEKPVVTDPVEPPPGLMQLRSRFR